MPPQRDRTGERRGRLTLLAPDKPTRPSREVYWRARCDCGNEIVIRGSSRTYSCGCALTEWLKKGQARKSHGYRHTPEYRAWTEMKQTCFNVKHPRYARVGGVGITVEPAWVKDFQVFLKDVGPKPGSGYRLIRMDKTLDFVPGNVKWILRSRAEE